MSLEEKHYSLVADLIADYFGVSRDSIAMGSSLSHDLGLDSLDLVDLFMVLKDNYRLKLTDDQVSSVKTVGDICRILKEQDV